MKYSIIKIKFKFKFKFKFLKNSIYIKKSKFSSFTWVQVFFSILAKIHYKKKFTSIQNCLKFEFS